jgi:hypothetical protein
VRDSEVKADHLPIAAALEGEFKAEADHLLIAAALERDSEVEADRLPIAAALERYSAIIFPKTRVVTSKLWTPYEEAVLRQWDGEGRRITVSQLRRFLPGRETTQISVRIRKLFHVKPVEPAGAVIMRKAEKRVVDFRAINRGDANPWIVVLLMKPQSSWGDIALLAGLLSHVGGTFITMEAKQNKQARTATARPVCLAAPSDECVVFGFLFNGSRAYGRQRRPRVLLVSWRGCSGP